VDVFRGAGLGVAWRVHPVTINYVNDSLSRLTGATYSMVDYYHYTYDAVGNRLTQTTQSSVTSYHYNDANRLSS
jgi:hypothetical protein